MMDLFGLTDRELVDLVRTVFAPTSEDRTLLLITDLPTKVDEDDEGWRERRAMAADWYRRLSAHGDELGLDCRLALYRRAGAHNGPLPDRAWLWDGPLPSDISAAAKRPSEPFDAILGTADIVIAPTHFSATAPLKITAPRLDFRAATMPGFSRLMIPALRLDWTEIDRRVRHLAELLTVADRAELSFEIPAGRRRLVLDLRHRTAHASGGIVRKRGTAGNLPSGESFIVPYEGEIPGERSRTEGILPVQWRDEVVEYRVEANRGVEVLSRGLESDREARRLAAEPAYGNLAELGLGVLGPFGIEPIGQLLLDEKLGLHIAFGRSDHFGGRVGPGDFFEPAAVVHADHVYLPATQPQVRVQRLVLVADGLETAIIADDDYVIDFDC